MKKVFLFLLCLSFVLTAFAACAPKREPTVLNSEPVEEKNAFLTPYLRQQSSFADIASQVLQWFSERKDESVEIRVYPIYSTYLEPTTLCCCAFFQNGELTGARNVAVEQLETVMDGNYTIKELPIHAVFSDQTSFSILQNRVKYLPDYTVEGVIFDELGVPNEYLLVRTPDGLRLQYVYGGEACDFQLVKPFETVEEGRAAFAAYRKFISGIREQLPVYSWRESRFYEGDFLNMYRYEYAWKDNTAIDRNALIDADNYIGIPLLSPDGKEDQAVLYLVFLKGDLIAELVIQRDDKTVLKGTVLAFAEKDENGAYISLEGSIYGKCVNDFLKENPEADVQGICFENGHFSAICRTGGRKTVKKDLAF